MSHLLASRAYGTLAARVTVASSLLLLPACCEDEQVSARDELAARAAGAWRTVLTIGDESGRIYATDTYRFSGSEQTISAVAYFDEALTTPFLRYEARLAIEAVERSPTIPDGYEIDLRTVAATMTALVDDPALYAAFGLDDCGLQVGVAVDVSQSDCGVPLFRDHTCVEQDLYQVAAGATELRNGVVTDKCVERPREIVADQVYARVE